MSETAVKAYKIGELARQTGATTRTLRYYEELGLLEPLRNHSGQRLYGEDSFARLNFINELKSGGFSLIEIKTFFESWQQTETGAQAAEATMDLIQHKLTEITELQQRLNRLNDELRAMVTYLIACRSCERKPSASSCGTCENHGHQGAPRHLVNLLQKPLQKESM
jgi:DNA-binding transcriptional MerR regulator